jgi:hypothetical protein
MKKQPTGGHKHTATTSTLMAYAALVGTVEAERNVAASIV